MTSNYSVAALWPEVEQLFDTARREELDRYTHILARESARFYAWIDKNQFRNNNSAILSIQNAPELHEKATAHLIEIRNVLMMVIARRTLERTLASANTLLHSCIAEMTALSTSLPLTPEARLALDAHIEASRNLARPVLQQPASDGLMVLLVENVRGAITELGAVMEALRGVWGVGEMAEEEARRGMERDWRNLRRGESGRGSGRGRGRGSRRGSGRGSGSGSGEVAGVEIEAGEGSRGDSTREESQRGEPSGKRARRGGKGK